MRIDFSENPGFWSMISSLDSETVLTGPDRGPDDVCIDPIMGKRFDDVLDDLCIDLGIRQPSRTGVSEGSPLSVHVRSVLAAAEPLMVLQGEVPVRIVPVSNASDWEIGVAALERHDDGVVHLVGAFCGADVCVAPAARGRGIGRALVFTRMLMDEGLPTWDHDTPGYSPDGVEVIRKAHDELLEIAQIGIDRQPPSAMALEAIRKYRLDLVTQSRAPALASTSDPGPAT